jgi:hypothetical protein
MKKYAPLATLVAAVLLGAVLLVVNMVNTPGPPRAVAAPAAAAPNGPAPADPAPARAAPADPAPADPGPAAPPPAAPVVAEKAYTGRSAGNEVTVAIAVKDGRAVAYVCDGRKVEAWMEGTLAGEQLSLQGTTSSLSATVSDRATLGSITVDGTEWPFAAKGVAAPAGLYEGRGTLRGVAARVGWIVEDDGNVTGLANLAGRIRPAPVIDPAAPRAITVDGNTVTVTPVGGNASVVAP